MNTTTATAKWTLISLSTSTFATPCDHCERDVKRGFVVSDAEGRQLRVGRGCVKKLTGWTLGELVANALADRMSLVRAEFPTLNDEQVSSVAAHDYNWRADRWRDQAASYAQWNAQR